MAKAILLFYREIENPLMIQGSEKKETKRTGRFWDEPG